MQHLVVNIGIKLIFFLPSIGNVPELRMIELIMKMNLIKFVETLMLGLKLKLIEFVRKKKIKEKLYSKNMQVN